MFLEEQHSLLHIKALTEADGHRAGQREAVQDEVLIHLVICFVVNDKVFLGCGFFFCLILFFQKNHLANTILDIEIPAITLYLIFLNVIFFSYVLSHLITNFKIITKHRCMARTHLSRIFLYPKLCNIIYFSFLNSI